MPVTSVAVFSAQGRTWHLEQLLGESLLPTACPAAMPWSASQVTLCSHRSTAGGTRKEHLTQGWVGSSHLISDKKTEAECWEPLHGGPRLRSQPVVPALRRLKQENHMSPQVQGQLWNISRPESEKDPGGQECEGFYFYNSPPLFTIEGASSYLLNIIHWSSSFFFNLICHALQHNSRWCQFLSFFQSNQVTYVMGSRDRDHLSADMHRAYCM